MHQLWKQGNALSNTRKCPKDTITSNLLPELCREGLRMIVLVSLIVLLRAFPCFHDFSHGASHPYIPIHSIYVFMVCVIMIINAATRMSIYNRLA